ncbi:MAG TPA: hypothetical protein DCO68_09495 [Methylophilaceae bacterium]|nr:hypothetical protein [Methylophilaceae bacterium]HAJ72296.1 hypothetical protein [Methylophilaceae bacterium]
MLTLSKIKMKLVMIKSELFSFSKKQKIKDCRLIEELSFKSVFEADVCDVLRKKWTDNSWIFEATAEVLEVFYTITEILKLIFER